MVNKNYEILKRIHLLMEYDSKKTLTENESLLTEQGDPIPMPSTQLPSDYTGDYGTQTQTYTPQIYRQKVTDDKNKELQKQKEQNIKYPRSQQEGNNFRAWFNQTFPFKSQKPCPNTDGKLDLTGPFDNDFIKCAADFDKYGKRAFKMFLEHVSSGNKILKVYNTAKDRYTQLGIKPGFSESDLKEFNKFKTKRDRECSSKLAEFNKKAEPIIKKNRTEYYNSIRGGSMSGGGGVAKKNEDFLTPELKKEKEEIKKYCVTEVENLKNGMYRPQFPFGISNEEFTNFLFLKATIEKTYPYSIFDKMWCSDRKNFELMTGKEYKFIDPLDCQTRIEKQTKEKTNQLKYLEKQFGYVEPKSNEKEGWFSGWIRFGIEFVGMIVISVVSGLLAPETGGATAAIAASSAARARILYELLLSTAFFGTIAAYDWKRGDTKHATIDILFIFLPFLHKVSFIKSALSKFSSEEVLVYSKKIAELLKNNPIRSAQDAENFIKILNNADPKMSEFFLKAVSLDKSIVQAGFEQIETKALKELGEKRALEIFKQTAKELGIKTSFKTSVPEIFGGGTRYLTNSRVVNALMKFGVQTSIDLSILESLASLAYNLFDFQKIDQEKGFEKLLEYYGNIKDPRQREEEIKKDIEGLKNKDKQTETKFVEIAKDAYQEKKEKELYSDKDAQKQRNVELEKLKEKLKNN